MKKNLKFIDLFAGIGGFHLAFHELGCECVFASEIDINARKTYEANFKKISPQIFSNGLFNSDILQVNYDEIPDFDILCAGFPCQPFSQAGHKQGFKDSKESRGNMFFKLSEIIQAKRPKAFFLENVRHLLNHEHGRTFSTIKKILTEDLNYQIFYKIIKASDYGLPQHRPRVYIIGFDNNLKLPADFTFPSKIDLKYTMSDIFGGKCSRDIGYTLRVGGRGSTIDDRRNWEFYRVNGNVVRLELEAGKKMMGLPSSYIFPVSFTQAMKQLGNGVAVSAVYHVGRSLIQHLDKIGKKPELTIDNQTESFVVSYV